MKLVILTEEEMKKHVDAIEDGLNAVQMAENLAVKLAEKDIVLSEGVAIDSCSCGNVIVAQED